MSLSALATDAHRPIIIISLSCVCGDATLKFLSFYLFYYLIFLGFRYAIVCLWERHLRVAQCAQDFFCLRFVRLTWLTYLEVHFTQHIRMESIVAWIWIPGNHKNLTSLVSPVLPSNIENCINNLNCAPLCVTVSARRALISYVAH